MKAKLLAICTLACLCATGNGLAQWTQRGPSGELNKEEASRLIDAINHVEADLFSRSHAYVSLEKLPLDHLTTMQKGFSASEIASGNLKDHRLRLIASADGKHYLLAILPVPSGCGFSMFSDETANLFEAPQLDCADEH
jgi:hypothetical protein